MNPITPRTHYVHGHVFTSHPEAPFAEAFTVCDGRIVAVGTTEEILAERDPADLVEDLAGQTVIPGIVDAHMHPQMLAEFTPQISALPPAIGSLADLAQAIQGQREAQGPGLWIQCWGYDEGKFSERRPPTRYDLDAGCSDSPVVAVRNCTHLYSVNSKALEICGITRDTPDPEGGEIERDAAGEPTGILKENAANLVMPFLPQPSHEDRIQWLLALGRLMAQQGLVAVADMGIYSIDEFQLYEQAADRGFAQELAGYFSWGALSQEPDFAILPAWKDRDRQIRVAGLKLLGDGSFGGHTAWVDQAYLQDPTDFGIQVCSAELLESAIVRAKEEGLQLSAHAMGGRSIAMMVDRISQETPWLSDALSQEGIPFARIEHVTEPRAESMEKAARAGIAFVTQPIFFFSEVESYLLNLGSERLQKTYPLQKMLEVGIDLALSTDAPATAWATPSEPFITLQAAVTKRAYEGTDCGLAEKLDIQTAVRLYTREAARVCGFEGLGMIQPGYKASFLILSDDLFAVSPEAIGKVHPVATYIRGEKVFG